MEGKPLEYSRKMKEIDDLYEVTDMEKHRSLKDWEAVIKEKDDFAKITQKSEHS